MCSNNQTATLLACDAARMIGRLSLRNPSSQEPMSSAWRTVGAMPSEAQQKAALSSAINPSKAHSLVPNEPEGSRFKRWGAPLA